MRIASLVLATLLFLVPAIAGATAQQADILLLDGKAEGIFTNPLESYLEKNEKLRFEPTSSANWRGYVATFAIRDDGLWLEKVEVSRYVQEGEDYKRVVEDRLDTLFPGKKAVLADWYTGVLLIPRGKCQRRFKSDPLDRVIADLNLTHSGAHGLRCDRTVPALRLSFNR